MVLEYLERVSGERSRDDIVHGLPVIIFSRWVLVVAGLVLALWNASDLAELQVSVLLILALAVGNFFLHVEVFRRRQIDRRIVYGASIVDVLVISIVVIVAGNFPSNVYVFYLPALLAISVTFPTAVTALYTAAALAVYGLFAVAVSADTNALDPQGPVIVAHLLVMAAVPFCGNVYWRQERSRRRKEQQIDSIRRELAEEPAQSSDREMVAEETRGA